MKTRLILLSLAVLFAAACAKTTAPEPQDGPEAAFSITPPEPAEALTRLNLSVTEQGYIAVGNTMSMRLFKQLARETATTYVCSPLSLQLALGMLANGTEAETQKEILDAIGFGQDGLPVLNLYARHLLQQLPALGLNGNVNFRVADALLVTDRYQLGETFYNTLRNFYYAPAASVSFSDPQYVLNLVNDWANQATQGLINPMLSDLDPNAVALLLNALYFKAPWKQVGGEALFNPDATADGAFYRSLGTETKVQYMNAAQTFAYADRGKYEVLGIPYDSGKYYLYILLPKQIGDLYVMLDELIATPWADVVPHGLESEQINLFLPKFDISGDFNLNNALGGLGVHRIFDDTKAQFGPMFDIDKSGFYVSRVLQKARLSLTEWGTEAGAVTAVEVTEKGSLSPKKTFKADHPFLFVIAGFEPVMPILFGGVYTGV